jgi:hypothetical protein
MAKLKRGDWVKVSLSEPAECSCFKEDCTGECGYDPNDIDIDILEVRGRCEKDSWISTDSVVFMDKDIIEVRRKGN